MSVSLVNAMHALVDVGSDVYVFDGTRPDQLSELRKLIIYKLECVHIELAQCPVVIKKLCKHSDAGLGAALNDATVRHHLVQP